MSKMTQTWVCGKCEVKLTQLRSSFGSWPVPGFTKKSTAEQQAFFREAKDMNGQELAKEAGELYCISEDVEIKFDSNGGKFLPLNVWAAKGYDRDAIEAKTLPEDIREHPVLGRTYR